MYYSYFGLREAPFSIAVNPRYLYMSPSHRDALAHLLYGVGAGGGFILLTGEVGTGKTTINRCLIEQLPDNADLAIVLNPALDARDLLAAVCEELEILPDGETPGLKALTDALHAFLLDNHARGRKTVLMIDEAQHLSFAVLEQIRLLTNLETNEEKLLHIILIGQPELGARLARPELRQLNQRITARFDLAPLSVQETGAYIRHRLHVAGLPTGRSLFSDRLVRAIHRESGGVPRLINLLCDRLLLGAYGRSADRPDRGLLRAAVREVLGEGSASARPGRRQVGILLAGVVAVALVGSALWLLLAPRAPTLSPELGGKEPEMPTEQARRAEEPVTAGERRTPEPESGAAWFLTPVQGVSALGQLYGLGWERSEATDPCRAPRPPSTECAMIEDATWSSLLEESRPALLRLIDEQRVEGRTLFLGMERNQALVATPGGGDQLPVGELGRLWTGEAWRLWQRPGNVERPLSRGDRGPDVEIVARLFATLDGQARSLGGGIYDERLEERVRLFQAGRGLTADGVLGEQTLRALVLAAGADLDLGAARVAVEARGLEPGP